MHEVSSSCCYTVGHSTHPVDRFISLLHQTGIDTVIDVRSTPYSRFNPQFNRQNLEKSLTEEHIKYEFFGDRLGGRYTDPALLLPNGTVDYRKVQDTEQFKKGIGRLMEIIASGKLVALMCAEKEPEKCHRFLLIAPILEEAGVRVVHVRGDGTFQDHGTSESRGIK